MVLRLSLVSMETAYYCSFGNTSQPVPATFVNASSLQCTTPEYGIAEPGAGWEVVQLSVTDNLEQWTAAYVPYTYIGPYNLSEVQPMRGPKQGLTVVTLVGENLAAAQPLYCLFDNVSVTAVQVTTSAGRVHVARVDLGAGRPVRVRGDVRGVVQPPGAAHASAGWVGQR